MTTQACLITFEIANHEKLNCKFENLILTFVTVIDCYITIIREKIEKTNEIKN